MGNGLFIKCSSYLLANSPQGNAFLKIKVSDWNVIRNVKTLYKRATQVHLTANMQKQFLKNFSHNPNVSNHYYIETSDGENIPFLWQACNWPQQEQNKTKKLLFQKHRKYLNGTPRVIWTLCHWEHNRIWFLLQSSPHWSSMLFHPFPPTYFCCYCNTSMGRVGIFSSSPLSDDRHAAVGYMPCACLQSSWV